MAKKIAVISVRGFIKLKKDVKDTLRMMRLYNKNYCVVFDNIPAKMGMIKKVKDYVTYGEIDEATFKELVSKRGEIYTGREKDEKMDMSRKYMEVDGKKYNKFFRLAPPRKGYGRAGIKRPFSKAGALGYRGIKINDLIRRMI
jgi:large subunit ribosomal protein L30